jgi:uncharacterized repeat protein (TIGR03803 family)
MAQQIAIRIVNIKLRARAAALVSLAILAAILLTIPTAQAQTFTVLHTFTGGGDGADSLAGLTFDRAGNLYGTTHSGGTSSGGTAFKLKKNGSGWLLTPLYEFSYQSSGGANPSGGVIFGPDGSLYGTASTSNSGFGTVYKLQPSASACKTSICYWTENVLHGFAAGSDGHQPTGNLIFDQAGNIYGTTQAGGTFGYGTVFKLTNSGGDWTESVLYSFAAGQDGNQPTDGVVMDSAGNLFGTTPYGGINNCQGGCGTVFELTPSGSGWSEQIIYRFQGVPDAQRPYAGLIIDSAGNLYGASYEGGENGGGTVFELSPAAGSWNYTVLYNLTGSDNGPFARLTMDSSGNLYDTTISPSTIFELSPSGGGWTYTDLHDFSGNDGSYPRGSLTLDGEGNLYGTTSVDGADGQGTAWELTP